MEDLKTNSFYNIIDMRISAFLADQSPYDFWPRFGPFILIPERFQPKNDSGGCLVYLEDTYNFV